jgi:tripartite-type tricarboxylate transporter receptor subunit TctC
MCGPRRHRLITAKRNDPQSGRRPRPLWRAAFLALALIVPPAAADPYPAKPIKLIIAFASGSATDSMGRVIADRLSHRLGQQVVVENRAGATGMLAAAHVARSAPDGYTLLMTTNSTHGANSYIYKSLPYDPIRDFEPIARTATLPFMLVVNPAVPADTTAQFIAYARSRRGELSYGTASTTSLIGAETVNRMAGTGLVGVSYKASTQAMLDLVAGRLQVMVADFATAMPQVKAGKVKVLGVTTAKRSVLLPGVPPMAEALPGFDVTSWNGVFAPAGTADIIVARLAREILAVLDDPQTVKRLAEIGFEVDPMGPEAFASYVREQIGYWGKLARDAGIQPQ